MCSNRTWSFCMSQGLVPHDPRWRERCGWQISSCFGVGPVCGQFLRGWCSWMCFGSCVAAPLHHNLLLISGFLRHHRTLNLPIFAIASHATKPSGHILAFFFTHSFQFNQHFSTKSNPYPPSPIPPGVTEELAAAHQLPLGASQWLSASASASASTPLRCAAVESGVTAKLTEAPGWEKHLCFWGRLRGGRMQDDDWLMIDWYWLILIDDWLILIDIDWWLIDIDWYWLMIDWCWLILIDWYDWWIIDWSINIDHMDDSWISPMWWSMCFFFGGGIPEVFSRKYLVKSAEIGSICFLYTISIYDLFTLGIIWLYLYSMFRGSWVPNISHNKWSPENILQVRMQNFSEDLGQAAQAQLSTREKIVPPTKLRIACRHEGPQITLKMTGPKSRGLFLRPIQSPTTQGESMNICGLL